MDICINKSAESAIKCELMDTWNRNTMDALHFTTGAIGASEARILLGALLLACHSFIASYAYGEYKNAK